MKNFAPQISLMTMLFLTSFVIKAQNVGINATGVAPGASAGLDIDFTNKGLLIPRVSIGNVAAAAPVTAPATSLLVYNTNAAITGGTGVGYYYWDGSKWVNFWTGNNFGVDNGLYYNTGASKVRLGGALVENTTVTQAGFQMDWDLTGTGDFNVMDAGVTRFSVQDNGNVTVGSTANTAAFNVTGESYFSDDLYLRDGAVTAGDILLRLYDSSDDGVIDVYANNSVNHRIHGNGQTIFNSLGLGVDFTIETPTKPFMFNVDASGNQIIVNGATQLLGYTDPFSVYVTDNGSIPFCVNGWNQGTTGGAATMQITNASNGYNALEATTTGTGGGAFVWRSNTSNNMRALLVQNSAGNNSYGVYDNDNTVALNYFVISDSRLKRDIVGIGSGLAEVMKLTPVNYYLDNEKYPSFGTSNDLQYGFLAQDVAVLFPSLVNENSIMDPNQIPTDPRADWSKVETPFSAVNYQGLIPVLTKAIQEQQALIEAQNKKIEELEILIKNK